MSAEIKLLRKGSVGIIGTYRNAEHHAKNCLPLIKILEAIITSYAHDEDYESFKWEQGNNIHIITRNLDGAQLAFRPYSDHETWGIDVLAKFARSDEMRLVTITNPETASLFGVFLGEFLLVQENLYGAKEHKNNSRAE